MRDADAMNCIPLVESRRKISCQTDPVTDLSLKTLKPLRGTRKALNSRTSRTPMPSVCSVTAVGRSVCSAVEREPEGNLSSPIHIPIPSAVFRFKQ